VFDLLHVEGDDLRRYELIERRALLRKYTARAEPAILYSEHMEGEEGEAMFRHACRLGPEGIVSKRATSRYNSGRCDAWRKVKNPEYVRRRAGSVLIWPGLACTCVAMARLSLITITCTACATLLGCAGDTNLGHRPINGIPKSARG
jgi:hypothetical protein